MVADPYAQERYYNMRFLEGSYCTMFRTLRRTAPTLIDVQCA